MLIKGSKLSLILVSIILALLFAVPAGATTVDEIPDFSLKIGADYYSMTSNFFDDEHLFNGWDYGYTAHIKYNGNWYDLLTATDEEIFGGDPGVGVDAIKQTASRNYYDNEKLVHLVTNSQPSEFTVESMALTANSSLNVLGGPDITDVTDSVWVCKEDNNNIVLGDLSDEPLGTMTIQFSKNVKKSSTNDFKIYLNDSTTEPVNASEIKALLFSTFVSPDGTSSASNEVGADISVLSFSGLKSILDLYNNDQAVTSITIVGESADGSGEASVTLNLQ